MASVQRFRDLGRGELRSLLGLHAPGARLEQHCADAVLVAQRWFPQVSAFD
jgi:hypothetical protein